MSASSSCTEGMTEMDEDELNELYELELMEEEARAASLEEEASGSVSLSLSLP